MAKCRDRRLMIDVSSGLGEDRVLWGGCMKRRVQRNTLSRKIDNFWSTYAWTPSNAHATRKRGTARTSNGRTATSRDCVRPPGVRPLPPACVPQPAIYSRNLSRESVSLCRGRAPAAGPQRPARMAEARRLAHVNIWTVRRCSLALQWH